MAPSELTDEHVAAAAAGRTEGLSAIYEVLSPRVLGYLRAHGAVDPEGLTNDVFLQLLPRVARISGGAEGVRRLAFTIARARLIDSIRARGRSLAVPYDADQDGRTAPSAEDAADGTLGLARVRAVLDTLPEDQRQAVTLRVIGDLSIEQTAQVMGRSEGAVKQLQRRGLLALRAAIAQGRVTL